MADLPVRAPRVRAVGWPMLATGVAALLALVALTQPLWAFQIDMGGRNVDKAMYTWTARVEEEWRNGTLATTTITPYSSPTFTDFRMRDAAVATYDAGALYALLLVVLAGLQFGEQRGRTSRRAVLSFHLLVVILGMATLAFAAIAIPPAARVNIDPAVSGFWGQAVVGGDVLSWGPGIAWWLWAVAAVVTVLALAVPHLQQRRLASPQIPR